MVMTKSQFDTELAKVREKNQSIEYRRRLREERRKYWPKFVMPSTSKIVLIVAALLCVEILFFCQYMILVTGDTNALYAMVGTIVTLASIILGYFVKSTKENTDGGIVYLNAMNQAATAQQPTVSPATENTGAVG